MRIKEVGSFALVQVSHKLSKTKSLVTIRLELRLGIIAKLTSRTTECSPISTSFPWTTQEVKCKKKY